MEYNGEEPVSVLSADIRRAGYEEGRPIVRDIRFRVGAGELVGLIGPNGAGKSTTIKTILGLLRYVDGDITIGGGGRDGGENQDGSEVGRAVGGSGRYAYVPEQPVLYEYFTLWEHLRLAAAAFGIEEERFRPRAEELLRRFRLDGARDELPIRFSKGMQQKLMLIIGFMLEPDVYIVDEPFVGLDPRATRDFLELLEAERLRGAGVLMSTHVLDTAERICDTFVLIDNGSVVAQGSLADVRRTAGAADDAPLFDCFHALT